MMEQKKQIGIVDRLEGPVVIVENERGDFVELPLDYFRIRPHEGDRIDLVTLEIIASPKESKGGGTKNIDKYFKE